MGVARVRRHPDKRFAETVYLVEATDYEQLALWKEWHQFVPSWVEDSSGYGLEVGRRAGLPVVVSVTWAIINGKRVCFYEAVSQMVDHGMVEKWRHEEFPKLRGAHCNAMNFAHCLEALWPHETRSAARMAAWHLREKEMAR